MPQEPPPPPPPLPDDNIIPLDEILKHRLLALDYATSVPIIEWEGRGRIDIVCARARLIFKFMKAG